MVACCNDCCHVFFIALHWLVVIFHSTVYLDLSENSLRGIIPSQIALMSNLGESRVVWMLIVMIVVMCFIALSCLLVFFNSTDDLQLYNNNFTGEFTCPAFIDHCQISCWDDIEACRSLLRY